MIKFLVGNKIQIGAFVVLALALGWFYGKAAHYEGKYREANAAIFVYESRVADFEQSIAQLQFTVKKQTDGLYLLAVSQAEAQQAAKEALKAITPMIKEKRTLIALAEQAQRTPMTCAQAVATVKEQLAIEVANENN